jgi:hypothetical protein
MLTRRRFLNSSALAPAVMGCRRLLPSAAAQTAAAPNPLRLAVIGSSYHYGSELQTLADRFLVGYANEGDWHMPNVQVVSMYVENRPRTSRAAEQRGSAGQRAQRPTVAQSAYKGPPLTGFGVRSTPEPENKPVNTADLSEGRSNEFGFRLCANIPDALRCGGDQIAVDAVLSVVEHGNYPRNPKGQILYPRYDFFEQCAQVFEEDKRSVPYFNHGSLSFSFRDAKTMVATADRLKFPMLAGSSLPVTWRLPDIDIPMGGQIEQAVMVCPFDGMEFDAIEAMQCMMERRKGGETGIKTVQCLDGDDVWAAGESGRWSKELLSSALSRSDAPLGLTVLDGRTQDLVASGVLPQLVKQPAAYCIEYHDGTRATMLMLQGGDQDFTFSARVAGHGLIATQFFRSPVPNVTYSAALAAKIEQMFTTHSAPYPVHRTLLTSGLLEAALISRAHGNQKIDTPHLMVSYQPPSESQYART